MLYFLIILQNQTSIILYLKHLLHTYMYNEIQYVLIPFVLCTVLHVTCTTML